MMYNLDCSKQKPNCKGIKMTNNQLEKLRFGSKEDAAQFATLLEVALWVDPDKTRYVVMAGQLHYHVIKERYFKRFGYWKSV